MAPNLTISISLFPYALTFLLSFLILHHFKIKTAQKALMTSALFVLWFYLIVTILCTISTHLDSMMIDQALRTVFTPNFFRLGSLIVYYPDMFIFFFLAIYLLSHNIMLSLYNAVKSATNIHLGFAVAIFTTIIIDTMLMVPMSHINDIYLVEIDIVEIIRYLTGAFIITISTCLVLILSSPFWLKESN